MANILDDINDFDEESNPGYKKFNQALRGEIPMTTEFKIQKELMMNKGLDKLPKYQSESLLYRIENLTPQQIDEYYKIGKTIENKHFTSSTYDMDAIGVAMRNRAYTVLIRIKGKNGKVIEDLSTLKSEKEVLFKSNTKFEVKDIRESTSPEDFISKIKTIELIEK